MAGPVSFGDKLSMLPGRQGGPEVAFIRRNSSPWGPTYEIYRQGQLYAVVKKELFTFFRCRFNVDVPGPNDYEAEGDFLDREYTFTRAGPARWPTSRNATSPGPTPTASTSPDGEDDVTLLASIIVIDLCCHADKKRH